MVTSAKKTSIVFDAFNKKENRLFNALIALIVILNTALIVMKMISEPANWFTILYYCSSISVLTTLIMLSVEDLATKMVSNTFLYFGLFGSLAIALLYLFFDGDYFGYLCIFILAHKKLFFSYKKQRGSGRWRYLCSCYYSWAIRFCFNNNSYISSCALSLTSHTIIKR